MGTLAPEDYREMVRMVREAAAKREAGYFAPAGRRLQPRRIMIQHPHAYSDRGSLWMSDDEGEGKETVVPKLVAKVTEWKSTERARFECCEVYWLWNNDGVTVDQCVEDEEWGACEESQKMAHRNDYPEGFFKVGYHRMIDQSGAMQEEPL